MSRRFLLEIGTEEIPASFQAPAARQLGERFASWCAEHGLGEVGCTAYVTPRRLAILTDPLPDRQPERAELVWGPPQSVAFAADGKPTTALLKFAEKERVAVERLSTSERPGKGVYVCHRRVIEGRQVAELLAAFVSGTVGAFGFPKSMRWGSGTLRFARPIRWIVALHGDSVVPAEVDGIGTGRTTSGHRFMAPGPFEIATAADYLSVMEKGKVIPQPERRREIVLAGARRLAAEVGGSPLLTDSLVEEVVNLVEYPVPLRGGFDAAFLTVPEEVLSTAMMHHQKYFPVRGGNGTLLPEFIGVSNMEVADPAAIVKGYERVLRARLSDARFFFEEDMKEGLASKVESLRDVVFHERLGTSFAKMERFRAIAGRLARQVCPEKEAAVERGAFLAKADLETSMVYEFPELQGVMGRIYAAAQGEEDEVAAGIEEHYLPRFSGDRLPLTHVGAVVSLADRIDTLVGSFGIGQVPTGSEDPYALRRHALAILQITLDRRYRIPLRDSLAEAAHLYGTILTVPAGETVSQVWEFIVQRIRHLYRSRGFRPDLVDAVLAGDSDDVVDIDARMNAASRLAEGRDLSSASVAFKRIANITAKHPGGAVRGDLLTGGSERALREFHLAQRERILAAAGGGDYAAAFSLIVEYREPVDRFFTDVLVMDKDERVRTNRLNLLKEISVFLRSLIDFSLLQEPGQETPG